MLIFEEELQKKSGNEMHSYSLGQIVLKLS
jgi:hypothetical protein